MNKKLKWAIPFAVLAMTCGIAAGCGGGKHEHSYTKYINEGETHVMACPDCPDNAIDESTRKPHVYDQEDGTKCKCGATKEIVEKVSVTITNGTTDTNGSISIDKTTAETGDTVKVTITPAAKYQLKSIKVNDNDYSGLVVDGVMTFDIEEGVTAITVVAEFEKIANASINAEVVGKKYGDELYALADNTAAKLNADGAEAVDVTLTKIDGKLKLKVDEVVPGTYTLTVAEHAPVTFVVKKDTAYTEQITLNYNVMESLCTLWGNTDRDDLSNQSEGKIGHISGERQWIQVREEQDSVAFTTTLIPGGNRQGAFVRFAAENNDYANDEYVLVAKEEGDQKKLSWNKMDMPTDIKGKNLGLGGWDDIVRPLYEETPGTYQLTIVRDGADIYVYVDGVFKSKKTLDPKYATKKCYVGLYCEGGATGMSNSEGKNVRDFKIEAASKYINVSIENITGADANGTVALDKTNPKIGEQVTVTLTPSQGYKISGLEINGTKVDVTGTTYTFTAEKDTTVKGLFEQKQEVGTAEITISAATDFTANGATLKFECNGQKWEGQVDENGKVTLDGSTNAVVLGDHAVTVNMGGYEIALGKVTIARDTANTEKGVAELTLNSDTLCQVKKEQEFAGADLAKSQLTVKTDVQYHNKLKLAETLHGGAFAFNLKIPSGTTSPKGIVSIPIGGVTTVVKFDGSEANKVLELGYQGVTADDWFAYSQSHHLDLTKYWDNFAGEKGLTIVVTIDNATGAIATYAGESLGLATNQKYNRTRADNDKYKDITQIEIGNGHNNNGNVNVTVTLGYGVDTAALGVGSEIKTADVAFTVPSDITSGTKIAIISVDNEQVEYEVGQTDKMTLKEGDYTAYLYGYAKVPFTITTESTSVNLDLKETIAYASANDSKNEIKIDDTAKTITINGNGITDRDVSNRKINAEYVMTEEQKNAQDMTLTFTVKAKKKDNRQGSDWVGSRFGVQIGEGSYGFMVFPRNDSEASACDIGKLGKNLSINPDLGDDGGDHKWQGNTSEIKWLANNLFTDEGVIFKVVRTAGEENSTVHIYAQYDGQWVRLDLQPLDPVENETTYGDPITMANTVKNDIRFTACGDNWTFSNISIDTTAETLDSATICRSKITGTTDDLTGKTVTLTDKDDSSKTYTVDIQQNGGNYYIQGYFKAGNYTITCEGYTCQQNSTTPSDHLEIDETGGGLWGIKMTKTETTDPEDGGDTPTTGGEGEEQTPAE